MDEKDYELLHALDETRNITHAADKLYMTQSALSKRIKALEQELGVEIVLRSRQGIRFTPAGEQVLLHSAAAAREMEKMRRQLASIQGEACGTLRAGISVNFSYYRLPEVLTEYHKAYPKVRLDIATGHSRNIYQQMLDYKANKIYGVVLTTADGSEYGLHHVTNIWHGTKLGFNADDPYFASIIGKTITQITFYAADGVYVLPVNVAL